MLNKIIDVARSLFFDNASNSFSATDVQAAIEEARDTASGKVRFTLMAEYKGSIPSNFFIGERAEMPSDSTPFLVPRNCHLKELTLANISDASDYTFEFRKNTTTGTPFFSWNAVLGTNEFIKYIAALNYAFSAGDYFNIKAVKNSGNSLKDIVLVMYFQVD